MKFILNYLLRNFKSRIRLFFQGNIIISLPDKSEMCLGNKNKAVKFNIKSYKFLYRLFFFGTSEIGYSFKKKEWTTSNLEKFLELCLKNSTLLSSFNNYNPINFLSISNFKASLSSISSENSFFLSVSAPSINASSVLAKSCIKTFGCRKFFSTETKSSIRFPIT